MSEQRRLWCSLHHSFWRDCSACVEADYADLEHQLVEVKEERDDWKATAELCQNEDVKSAIIESQQEQLVEAQGKLGRMEKLFEGWQDNTLVPVGDVKADFARILYPKEGNDG